MRSWLSIAIVDLQSVSMACYAITRYNHAPYQPSWLSNEYDYKHAPESGAARVGVWALRRAHEK